MSWEWCRLKTLSAAQINSFVDGPFGSNLKTEHYTTNREVRIIQLNNIGAFEWRNTGTKYTTFEHAESLERCKTFPNDIVIAKMMPAGRAIIVPAIEELYVISSDCVRLRVAEGIVNKYLMYAINSPVVNSQVQDSVHGIGRSRTSLSKCKELLVPIPPAREQSSICISLNTIFSLLATVEITKEELSVETNSMKSKILDLAIRGKLVPQNPDDEPASVLLDRIRAEKEELIKQGKIKRDKKESVIFKSEDNSYYIQTGEQVEDITAWELDGLPENWDICILGEICDYGSCTKVETDQISDDEWILDLEDIEKNSGKVLCKTRKLERNAVSTKHKFSKGQVLYSKLRPYLNKVVLAEEDGYCTSEILPLKFLDTITPQYARYYLMSPTFLKYADKCSYGVKMPRLSTTDGKKAVFTIPPINEQLRIVTAIETAFIQLDEILNIIA